MRKIFTGAAFRCFPAPLQPWPGISVCLVCFFVCVCTVTDFPAEDKTTCIADVIGVLGRKCPILGNFAPPEAPRKPKISRIGCVARAGQPWRGQSGREHGPRVGSACVDIRPTPKTDVLVYTFAIRQCCRRNCFQADRPLRSFVPTYLVTTISHELLQQSR